MTTALFPPPKVQFSNSNGAPLSGGKVYFYEPGTVTPKDTYSDYAGTTANTNPVVLDSRGESTIRLVGRYDVVVKDASDVTVYSLSDVENPANKIEKTRGILLAEVKALAVPTTSDDKHVTVAGRTANGDGYAGEFYWSSSDLSTEVTADTQNGIYIPPNSDTTGASGAWVRDYAGDVYTEWFGATGNGTTDDYTAIQAAITYVEGIGGGRIILQAKKYVCDTGLSFSVDAPVCLEGAAGALKLGGYPELNFEGMTAGPAITVEKASNHLRGTKLRNLSIRLDTFATKGDGSIGLKMRSAKFFELDGVIIENFDINLDLDDNSFDFCFRGNIKNCQFLAAATNMIRLGGVAETTFYSCRVGAMGGTTGGHDYNMLIEAPAVSVSTDPNGNAFFDCIFIDSASGTNPTNAVRQTAGFYNRFISCAFEQATDAGFRTEYAAVGAINRTNASLINCWVDACGTRGIDIVKSHVRVIGCRVDPVSATSASIRVVAGSSSDFLDTVIADNTIEYQAEAAVSVEACNGVRVIGNSFQGAGTLPGVALLATTQDCKVAFNDHNNTTGVSDLGTTNRMIEEEWLALADGPRMQVKRFTGTTDGSGVAQFAHGIGTGNSKCLMAMAFYDGGASNAIPMTFAYCDNTNLQFTGGTATTAYRAFAIFSSDTAGW